MKLKGNRSNTGFTESFYDSEVGCFTEGTGSYRFNCGGGGGGSTTTTMPSPEQRKILQTQLGYAEEMKALGPQQFYAGDTLATQDPRSLLGLEAQEAAAGDVGAIGTTAAQRFQDAMAYDPMQDPRTEEYLQAMTAPLERQFMEETIPGLSSSAVKAGAFGGDRAAIMQGQAAADLATRMGETRATALQDIIDSNRRQQLGMMAQIPTLQDAALQGSQVLRDVGAGYEARTQAEIDAARERFEFGQDAPRQALRDASSMLGGIDFGTISKTTAGGGK